MSKYKICVAGAGGVGKSVSEGRWQRSFESLSSVGCGVNACLVLSFLLQALCVQFVRGRFVAVYDPT